MNDDLPDEYDDWFLVKWLRGKCQIHCPISFNKFIAVCFTESLSTLLEEFCRTIVFFIFSQELQFEKCSEDVQSGTKNNYQFTKRRSARKP